MSEQEEANVFDELGDDELFLCVGSLKVMSDFTKERYDDARAAAANRLADGDRRVVRSPLNNAKIGPVTKSDPPKVFEVTNENALADALEELGYSSEVESAYKVIAGHDELVDILIVSHPHLLERVKRVKRSTVEVMGEKSLAADVPVGPGGELDLPGIRIRRNEPRVSCTPDKNTALLAVMELVHNQKLYLDGTAPKELEA
jgi:hypothetical protein